MSESLFPINLEIESLFTDSSEMFDTRLSNGKSEAIMMSIGKDTSRIYLKSSLMYYCIGIGIIAKLIDGKISELS